MMYQIAPLFLGAALQSYSGTGVTARTHTAKLLRRVFLNSVQFLFQNIAVLIAYIPA